MGHHTRFAAMIPAEPDCTNPRDWATVLGLLTEIGGSTAAVERSVAAEDLGRVGAGRGSLGRMVDMEPEVTPLFTDELADCNRDSPIGNVSAPTPTEGAVCEGGVIRASNFSDF